MIADQALAAQPSGALELDGAGVTELLRAGGPALVEVCAPWCVYGLLLRARTNELARRLSGRIAVARVDVQRWPYIADLLRIRRIPALVFLRGRRVIHRWYGADVDVSFVETIALRRAVEERR